MTIAGYEGKIVEGVAVHKGEHVESDQRHLGQPPGSAGSTSRTHNGPVGGRVLKCAIRLFRFRLRIDAWIRSLAMIVVRCYCGSM